MKKTAARSSLAPNRGVEDQEDRRARLAHSRHGCAVVIAHGDRKFAVLVDRRGVRHAREILDTGILADALADEEFEMLADAFPWEV